MPFVFIKMVAGLPLEKKRKMVKKITKSISETIQVPEDGVFVFIEELNPENIAVKGILKCDQEKEIKINE